MVTLTGDQVKKLQSDLSLLQGYIAGINNLVEGILKVLEPTAVSKDKISSTEFDAVLASVIAKRRKHLANSSKRAQIKNSQKQGKNKYL